MGVVQYDQDKSKKELGLKEKPLDTLLSSIDSSSDDEELHINQRRGSQLATGKHPTFHLGNITQGAAKKLQEAKSVKEQQEMRNQFLKKQFENVKMAFKRDLKYVTGKGQILDNCIMLE